MTDDRQLPIQPDPGPAADPEPGRPAAEPAPGRRPTPPLPPPTRREPSSADVRPRRPEYRGEELDPDRGPGLGCFWFQMFVLGFFIVIIPVGLNLNWPFEVLAILLFVVIGLLLLTGQTVIFLLRLVAADRRSAGRRRPLASATKTVGEMEDELAGGAPEGGEAAIGSELPGEPEGTGDATGRDVAVEPEPITREAPPAATAADDAGPASDEVLPAPAPEPSTERRSDDPDGLSAPTPDDVVQAPDADTPAAAVDAPDAAGGDGPAVDAAGKPDPAGPEEPDPGVRQ